MWHCIFINVCNGLEKTTESYWNVNFNSWSQHSYIHSFTHHGHIQWLHKIPNTLCFHTIYCVVDTIWLISLLSVTHTNKVNISLLQKYSDLMLWLCRRPLGSNYSFQSSWISLYKLCTCWAQKLILFVLTQLMFLVLIGHLTSYRMGVRTATEQSQNSHRPWAETH